MKYLIKLDPGNNCYCSIEHSLFILSTFAKTIKRMYDEITSGLEKGDPMTADVRKSLVESGPISFIIQCYPKTLPSKHIATLTVSLTNPNPTSCIDLSADIHLFEDGTVAGDAGIAEIDDLVQYVLRELIRPFDGLEEE